MGNYMPYAYAGGAAAPSPALWKGYDPLRALADPGYAYECRMIGPDWFSLGSADSWTLTTVTSGTLTRVDQAGGGLIFDSAGYNADDDGINAQMKGECFKPAADKTLWFEAYCKFSTTTPDQYLVGLAQTDTTLIASGALDEANSSMLAFYSDVNTTATYLEFVTNKAASVDIDTHIADVVAATGIKLGFKVCTVRGALQVWPYINGVLQTADIVTDTDDIPITEMTPSFVAQVEQQAADAELTVGWFWVAQLR